MDTEKATEVEMKLLAPAEVQDKDAENSKMEETKEARKEAEDKEKTEKKEKEEEPAVKPKLKNLTEGAEKIANEKEINEEETNVYCKLNNPTEDIYNSSVATAAPVQTEEKAEEKEKKEEEIKEEEGNVYSKLQTPTEDVYNTSVPTAAPRSIKAGKKKEKEEEEEEDEESSVYCKLKDPSENVYMSAMGSSTKKHNKDVYRKVVLFKRISAILIILSVLLLAVVIALALKLSELKSSHKCSTQVIQIPTQAPVKCPTNLQCGKLWVRFENSCYYISQHRLNWKQSRNVCQQKGGDLVVIDSENLQNFLSQHGVMQYWIGLRYSEKQWMWTDNTTLTKSYWANGQPADSAEGFCAMLYRATNKKQNTMPGHTKNWQTSFCKLTSNYICRKS